MTVCELLRKIIHIFNCLKTKFKSGEDHRRKAYVFVDIIQIDPKTNSEKVSYVEIAEFETIQDCCGIERLCINTRNKIKLFIALK